ncbi:MAG: disulfide bond formation protein B [Patescibacteria group bacterium]
MITVNELNSFLSILTVIGVMFIIFTLIILLFFKKNNNKFLMLFKNNAVPLAFFIALVSTGGSLFYSEIAKFPPCDLCWFQRIFMYPLIILLSLAWFKKDNRISFYSLPLVIIGFLFSLYHNYIYYTATESGFCSIINPCTQKYIVGFEYISIPLMALIAFVAIALLLMFKRK